MKKILQILIIAISIILGLYVGIWLMFVGGIIQIVNGINPLNGINIAIGICRIVFCEIAAIIPLLGVFIAGILEKNTKKLSNRAKTK